MAAAILLPIAAQLATAIIPGVSKEIQSLILMGIDKLFGSKATAGPQVSEVKNQVATAVFSALGQQAVSTGQAAATQIPDKTAISQSVSAAVSELNLRGVLQGKDTAIPIPTAAVPDPLAKIHALQNILAWITA